MTDALNSQQENQPSNHLTNNQKITPIVFQGKASEYFGIWIVNLLLSLVTLGIYSAWAKVRRKKYFYNNTSIDNVGFDYHANPKAILKGRIIAFVFFFCYGQSAHINPFLPFVFMVVFLLAMPWLVVRGSLFNARNTSHRGLRFDFVGKVNQAIRVFVGLPMLAPLTLGLNMPYVAHEKSQFMMNNHRFGLSKFEMDRVVKQYYKVYLVALIIPVFIIGVLAAIAIPQYKAYQEKVKAHVAQAVPNVQPFVTVDKRSAQANIVIAANEAPAEPQTVERVYSDNASTEAAPVATDELAAQTPEADVAAAEPAAMSAEELAAEEKAMDEMMKNQEKNKKEQMLKTMLNPAFWGAMIGALAVYAFFIFGFVGYLQARVHNLVWNNTKLDNLTFKSSLRARDMIGLYFTNILAIMCTLGLATPWAQIRMARYRTSKLQIVGDVDFDQFVGDKKAEVKATGEEIADMFDVDLSFG